MLSVQNISCFPAKLKICILCSNRGLAHRANASWWTCLKEVQRKCWLYRKLCRTATVEPSSPLLPLKTTKWRHSTFSRNSSWPRRKSSTEREGHRCETLTSSLADSLIISSLYLCSRRSLLARTVRAVQSWRKRKPSPVS